jgi:predicted 2-oxoglutarate/Fe(II)-dependent dioxygenase YbiX/peroxiredoxin
MKLMTAVSAEAPARLLYRTLTVGDPAPWFSQSCTSNPNFVFDTVAGRYVVLCFYGTASDPIGQEALSTIAGEAREFLDDDKIALFGVSFDPADRDEGRAQELIPGVRHFWDFDGRIGQLYGALPRDARSIGVEARRFWMVLNPDLRIRWVIPFKPDGSDRAEIVTYLRELPPVRDYAGFEIFAPVLVVPNVFEPGFCRHLIDLYRANGGEESGYMREVAGKTVAVHDPKHKRRKDYVIEDQNLMRQIQNRIIRRINPEIQKVHNFKPTRMERYIVSCYAAEDGGHFRAHRDNTTKGTAHRRFAVSINLNEEFEGGEVGFPEYGPRTYKAPAGGAVVFACSLLHSVSRVTAGERFAFLPFIYDDEAARLREANNVHLGDGVGAYRA